jgi:hypothetical protein
MDLSKILDGLKIQQSESDPPGMGVGVRVPRPKPKLPPGAAAVRPPREKKADN